MRIGGQDLARLQRGEIGALVELARRDAPLAALAGDLIGGAEAQHDGRHVVAGIAVGDIAAERADIAHLRVGDHQRGLAQDRDLRGQQIGADQLVLRGHGADDDVAAVGADAFEVGDARKVDQMVGRGEPQLHHRDQAVAAGERARVLAEIGEQGDGFVDGFRAVVGECAWDHGFLPGPSRRDRLRLPKRPVSIVDAKGESGRRRQQLRARAGGSRTNCRRAARTASALLT